MNTEDLKTISTVGQSLWSEPGRAEERAIETLAALSSLRVSEESVLEKATLALFQQAQQDGLGANASQIHLPFYRLNANERLILALLHEGRGTYERLSEMLKLPIHTIQELAWSARLALVASLDKPVAPPVGGGRNATCPEYVSQRPWTQIFLDDEMNEMERVFFQNHLMACASCQQSLDRARRLYYAVDSLIPRARNTDALRVAWDQTQELVNPRPMTFGRSMGIFFRRPQVLMVSLVFLGLVLAKIFGLIV